MTFGTFKKEAMPASFCNHCIKKSAQDQTNKSSRKGENFQILPNFAKKERCCGKKVAWAGAWGKMGSSPTASQFTKIATAPHGKLSDDMPALAMCNGSLESSNSCWQCPQHLSTWGHLAGSLSFLHRAIEKIGQTISQSDVTILRSKSPENLPNWFGAKVTIGSPTIWLGCCLPQHERVAMVKFDQIPFASFFSSSLSIFA